MYEKIYLINYKNRYLGYSCPTRSMVFAFRHKGYVEHVKKYIPCDALDIEPVTPFKYLLKNTENVCEPQKLVVEEKRLYSLIMQVGVNDMSVAFVHNVKDLKNGDVELNVKLMRKIMPLDDVKHNLEIMLKL